MLAEDERSGLFVESRGAMMGRQGRYTVLGEVIIPMIHANGSMTLLLELGRKAHVHAPTRDED